MVRANIVLPACSQRSYTTQPAMIEEVNIEADDRTVTAEVIGTPCDEPGELTAKETASTVTLRATMRRAEFECDASAEIYMLTVVLENDLGDRELVTNPEG